MVQVIYVVGFVGSGKTTLIHRLMVGYEAAGKRCVCIEEPKPGGRADSVAQNAGADVLFLERISADDVDAEPDDLVITLTAGAPASLEKHGALLVPDWMIDITDLNDPRRRLSAEARQKIEEYFRGGLTGVWSSSGPRPDQKRQSSIPKRRYLKGLFAQFRSGVRTVALRLRVSVLEVHRGSKQ